MSAEAPGAHPQMLPQVPEECPRGKAKSQRIELSALLCEHQTEQAPESRIILGEESCERCLQKQNRVGSESFAMSDSSMADSQVCRNVQVTLQILKALIEKSPRDLPLYAPYILRILSTVLYSQDISMVEESIPTFEAFCRYHDVATLAADQQHAGRYEEIVKTYAGYAALKTPVRPKGGLNASIAIRWRGAGLRAVKSITSSEAVGADGGRQLNIIMPIILQNLHSGDEDYLRQLLSRVDALESAERPQGTRRRVSVATIQTASGSSRPTSAAVTATVDDADRLAEEEVGTQAMVCLKQIFVANNRAQIRIATGSILKFICTRLPERSIEFSKSSKSGTNKSWSNTLIEIVTRWTPVQDRFVILVTIMETLVRSPAAEDNLEPQLLLVSLVGWLLRSDINMIGLSVMDVLLGLVQHILLLLQLGGKGSNVLPHHQQTDAIHLFDATEHVLDGAATINATKPGSNEEESIPSSSRHELLYRLQRCIGDLATHIYYSDQISDIISAILLRLKPSPMSSVKSDAAAIEHPQAAAQAISNSVQLKENPETDEFFSFGTARVTALNAIKEILCVANLKNKVSGSAAIGRNRVGVQVWEGTQWLLRDDDRRVRRAYVDALVTWLMLEMSTNDLRVMEDRRRLLKSTSRTDFDSGKRDTMTKRAVSNASRSGSTDKPSRSTFLQLLHLAIYDNAIEAPESESDLLLLHLLLANLIEKLGVNAAKTGLPMVMRLQEDINVDEVFSSPTAKLNIGSLVHGYFWKLCDKFDLDESAVGLAIQSEITRRRQHSLWMETIQIPPLPLEQIMSATSRPLSEKLPLPILRSESIKPFDSRPAMVDKIADAYAFSIASPPTSPPASPGKVFSMPILSSQGPTSTSINNELPLQIVETMLSEWSKEICIASVDKESTASLNGSRKGTNLSQYLGVNGQTTRNSSPSGAINPSKRSPLNEGDTTNQAQLLNFAFQNEHRRSSAQDTGSATPLTSSDQNQTLRVDDLKRVLTGGTVNGRGASPLRQNTAQHGFSSSNGRRSGSLSSESMASANGYESVSEGELARSLPPTAPHPQVLEDPKPPKSNHAASSNHSQRTSYSHPRSRPQSGVTDADKPPSTPRSLRRPSTSSSGEDPMANAAALRGEIVYPRLSSEVTEDEVPPVPPLPAGVTPAPRPISTGQIPSQSHQPTESAPAIRQINRASTGRKRGVDVTALLGSIDAVAGENSKHLMGRPPY